MAKITFNPTPPIEAPKSEPVVEEPQPVYDYSPKFNSEKASQMDAVIHALKLSSQKTPEEAEFDTKIAKYQKIIRLLRSI